MPHSRILVGFYMHGVLIDIENLPTVSHKERSPLWPTEASFFIYTNAKELEPWQNSRIHFAQMNSTSKGYQSTAFIPLGTSSRILAS